MKKLWCFLCMLSILPTVAKSEISVAELRAVLEENPEIIVDALTKYEKRQQAVAETEMQAIGKVYLNQINDDTNLPYVGPKDAKITLVEFFDYSCGYCKKLSPDIEQLIKNNPDVKVVFKPLTFVSSDSPYQAKAGFAAHKQGKFLQYYTKAMSSSHILKKDDVDQIAREINLDMDKFKADINDIENDEILKGVSDLTNKLKLKGVPTLYINGTNLKNPKYEDVQKAIDELLPPKLKKTTEPEEIQKTIDELLPQNLKKTTEPEEIQKADASEKLLEINGMQLLEHDFCNDEFGLRAICGIIKNNTDKEKTYAQIEINIYDQDGSQIGSTMDNINNLEPNGKWKFQAVILEDNVKSYKIKDISSF